MRMYGAAVANWLVATTDVVADPVTGNVFIAGARCYHSFFCRQRMPHPLCSALGTVTNPASLTHCNNNAANTNCGQITTTPAPPPPLLAS